MTNNLNRVAQMAEECGFVRTQFHGSDDYFYQATAEQILDYTQKAEQAVLAKRDEEQHCHPANCQDEMLWRKEIEPQQE